jgi:PAS domain S-box-containing protein
MTGPGKYTETEQERVLSELQRLRQENDLLRSLHDREINSIRETSETLDFLRSAIQNIPDSLALINSEGHFIDFSIQVNKMLGYSREELLSMSVSDIDPLYPADAWLDFTKRVKEAGSLTFESLFKNKEGRFIPVEIMTNAFMHNGEEYYLGYVHDISERKRVEIALQLEKDNFRSTLDESPLGIRIAALDGETIYANKALLNIFDYSNIEEFRNASINDRYTLESYDQALARKQQRINGDLSITNYEISIVRKNGEVRYLQVFRKSVLWNGIRQFLVIYNDITKARIAEQALRENENRYRTLFEDSLVGILLADARGRPIHANLAFARMFGYDNPGILYSEVDNVKMFYGHEEEMATSLMALQQKGSFDPREIDAVRRNGNHFPVLISANEVKDSDGNHLYYQATHIDLTERRIAEENLKTASFYARNLIEASLDPLMTVNADGKIMDINMATARITGVDREKLLGSDLTEYFTDPEEARRAYTIAFSEGTVRDYPLIVKNINGEVREVLFTATIFKDVKGDVVGVFASVHDITDFRKIEEELRKSKEMLEKINKYENDIRENERELISREIHDELGQSLTALKLDLGRMKNYTKDFPEAEKSLDDMVQLVSGTIKNVQRISADLRPGILDDLGLVSAIEWYCDEFEKRTGIKCTLNLNNLLYSDPRVNLTFFRILQETLTNVIRHARATSVWVELVQSDEITSLKVIDNGTGISENALHSSKSLGLISMNERVKQFNGSIEIKAGSDYGTSVIIAIPHNKI